MGSRDSRDRIARHRVHAFGAAIATVVIGLGLVSVPQATGAVPATLQHDADALRDNGAVGVLAEARDGATVVTARSGVAQRGTTTPVPLDARFRIGSTTKTFVATVVLQLVGEGLLSLDDTVERWLPGVIRGNKNDGTKITVRHLLQQSSGLFDYVNDTTFFSTLETPEAFAANRNRQYTLRQLVDVAVSHAPSFSAGKKYEYSNTNFVVVGMIVEAVTGQTWETEVTNRIILPLGLTGTSAPSSDPTIPAPSVRGYERFDSSGTYTDTTEHNMSWAGSTGALISTTTDVNRFFAALMRGELLAPAQMQQLKTTVPIRAGRAYPNAGYGLGIVRLDLPCGGFYWGHNGGVFGFAHHTGVTTDGSRTVSLMLSTHSIGDANYQSSSGSLAGTLVENALCNR